MSLTRSVRSRLAETRGGHPNHGQSRRLSFQSGTAPRVIHLAVRGWFSACKAYGQNGASRKTAQHSMPTQRAQQPIVFASIATETAVSVAYRLASTHTGRKESRSSVNNRDHIVRTQRDLSRKSTTTFFLVAKFLHRRPFCSCNLPKIRARGEADR